MRNRAKILILTLAACGMQFAACGTMEEQEGEIIGGVVGGIIGAQIGEGRGKTVAIIVGTMAGSMIGRHIAQTMDEHDRMYAAQTLHDARTGETTHWVNPDNGNIYQVTPTRTCEAESGPCREFTIDATIGSEPDQQLYGTACLQPDGSWELQP
jgi:surface antigen